MSRAVRQASMFRKQTHRSVYLLAFASVCLCFEGVSWGGDALQNSVKLSGAIGGVVTDSTGLPEMGARVILYNRQDRVYDKVLTDERGQFRFAGLFPDLYTVRVSLTTFVPALRKDILVQPGMQALLKVNLSWLFSSIQVAYPPPGSATFMTEDWKWMLRSASATRPVLRFVDDVGTALGNHPPPASAFSDTRGLLQLSAGDGALVSGASDEADLGTAFALATSIFGNSHLELSGNLGYGAQAGAPVTTFRTAYVSATGPEVSVTMRQVYLPGRFGAAGTADVAVPAMSSVTAGLEEHAEVSDDASLQYGFAMDSVSLSGDRLNYVSPYARLLYSLSDNNSLAFAFSSGNAHPDLEGSAGESGSPDPDLQRDLSAIGLFPRVSTVNNNPRIQRGNELEAAYSRKLGSRKVELSGYRETVTNAAISVVGPASMYADSDLLPDLFTGDAIFNAGNYTTSGYTAALIQNLGQNVSATIIYGTMPGMTVANQELVSSSPDELRSMIHVSHRQAVTAQVAATCPGVGTHLVASYQWLDDTGWLTLGNLYSMQSAREVPGLNLYIRQPIPRLLPWRIEFTADLRNLLAEGYLPVESGGQQLLLVQTPRSFRGGLSFIF
jgi:Carboxypeptidase regulatory-like domain